MFKDIIINLNMLMMLMWGSHLFWFASAEVDFLKDIGGMIFQSIFLLYAILSKGGK